MWRVGDTYGSAGTVDLAVVLGVELVWLAQYEPASLLPTHILDADSSTAVVLDDLVRSVESTSTNNAGGCAGSILLLRAELVLLKS